MKNIYEHKKSQSQSLNAIVTENNNKKIPFFTEQKKKSNDSFEMHTIYLERKEMKKFDKSEREKMPLRTQYQ